MSKKRSPSSHRWLREHFNDKYVKQAHKLGLRSRAWFKIQEIHHKEHLFKQGMNLIDLGSYPGGWSQFARKQIGVNGMIIACDILPMEPINGVNFLQGDINNELIIKELKKIINDNNIQLIMSDISPNISGIPSVDIARSIHLAEIVLSLCYKFLIVGGSFVVKVFQGYGFDKYLKDVRVKFKNVKIRKPSVSRLRSKEIYIIAKGYKL